MYQNSFGEERSKVVLFLSPFCFFISHQNALSNCNTTLSTLEPISCDNHQMSFILVMLEFGNPKQVVYTGPIRVASRVKIQGGIVVVVMLLLFVCFNFTDKLENSLH